MLIAGIYNLKNWKKDFEDYLEKKGMKSSTAKDYARRIEKVIEEENITIHTLSVEIDKWIQEYKTGKYASINRRKHYAPSSALMKFKEFYPTTYKPYNANQKGDLFESLMKPPTLIY